jgi:hypothetical protein
MMAQALGIGGGARPDGVGGEAPAPWGAGRALPGLPAGRDRSAAHRGDLRCMHRW